MEVDFHIACPLLLSGCVQTSSVSGKFSNLRVVKFDENSCNSSGTIVTLDR
jgi:hypothetical protein